MSGLKSLNFHRFFERSIPASVGCYVNAINAAEISSISSWDGY